MPIEVRNDMSPGVIADVVQTRVRQEAAEQAAATRRGRSTGLRQGGTAPRGPSQNAPNIGGFAQIQPEPVTNGPVEGADTRDALIQMELSTLFDGFNQYVDEFNAYDVDPGEVRKFRNTWKAIIEDDTLDYGSRKAALEAVLQRGQKMIDGAPKKRNYELEKKQAWLDSLKESNEPFVINPSTGEMEQNPYYDIRRQQAEDERKRQADALKQQREERLQQAQAAREQATKWTQEFRESQEEYRRSQDEMKREFDALDAATEKAEGEMKGVLAGANQAVQNMASGLSNRVSTSQAKQKEFAAKYDEALTELERRTQDLETLNPEALGEMPTEELVQLFAPNLRVDDPNARDVALKNAEVLRSSRMAERRRAEAKARSYEDLVREARTKETELLSEMAMLRETMFEMRRFQTPDELNAYLASRGVFSD